MLTSACLIHSEISLQGPCCQDEPILKHLHKLRLLILCSICQHSLANPILPNSWILKVEGSDEPQYVDPLFKALPSLYLLI